MHHGSACSRNHAGAWCPGAEDVTDGDVDYYGTDWINVENAATEEQMQKCFSEPCGGTARCTGNTPEQTDGQDYEMIQE